MSLAIAATPRTTPALRTAALAKTALRRHAAIRYERALALFEAIRAGIGDGGEVDPALDYYCERACAELVEAEDALVEAILAAQHEGDVVARRSYREAAHEEAEFAHGGQIYSATLDPEQEGLELGEWGPAGPAMVLAVRPEAG